MAAAFEYCVSFSKSGDYLAQSGADGRLKIWETQTNTLKQEYVPSSHLSATCTCLAWRPPRKFQEHSPRKKKKRRSTEAANEEDVIAVGTGSGSVLMYSTVKGDLVTQLDGEHTDRVNGVSWSADSCTIFSCSSDHNIVEWNAGSSKIKRKWKGDKRSVYAICCLPDGKSLLSASRVIKWWDLESQQIVKKFTGHSSEVFSLCHIPLNGLEGEGGYFISAAAGDRIINAWQLKSQSREENAVVTFSLSAEPLSVFVSDSAEPKQIVLLSVVTTTGLLQVFEHQLNGKCKTPMLPKMTVQVASNDTPPLPLPVVCAIPLSEAHKTILLGYGSHLMPYFERIPFRIEDMAQCLVRRDPRQAVSKVETSVSKVTTPEVGSEVTHLAPGHLVSRDVAGRGKKRRGREEGVSELPMEERLTALVLTQTKESSDIPKADNLSQLLLQGLHSSSTQILDSVLNRGEETIIKNTVKRLPVQSLLPLLTHLTGRLHLKGQTNHATVRWVRSVLQYHASYLLSCPDLHSLLGPVFSLIDARTALFPRVSQLRGRLDMMMSQISQRQTSKDTPQDAMLIFQDDSSDEASDALDELMLPSGSEDNWSELSMEDGEEDGNLSDEDIQED